MVKFSLAALALLLLSCGDKPPQATIASAPAAPISLLTTDEMTKLFLDHTKVWKFESSPGVLLKSVQLRFVEDGKPMASTGSPDAGLGGPITKLIVVVQELRDRHLVKLYQEHAGGSSSLSTLESWFSKPLQMAGSPVQTAIEPIGPRTIVLISGTTEVGTSGKTIVVESATAPCRLELVIE